MLWESYKLQSSSSGRPFLKMHISFNSFILLCIIFIGWVCEWLCVLYIYRIHRRGGKTKIYFCTFVIDGIEIIIILKFVIIPGDILEYNQKFCFSFLNMRDITLFTTACISRCTLIFECYALSEMINIPYTSNFSSFTN